MRASHSLARIVEDVVFAGTQKTCGQVIATGLSEEGVVKRGLSWTTKLCTFVLHL